MDRIDLKVGFSCNNRCSFCVQGDKREHHGARPLEELERRLEEGRRRGARAVVLTGGEPTLHRDILKIIRMAREVGYRELQVQTNGRLFAYRAFCEAMIDAGATEFSPALHGSTKEIHDGLTRAPGSFEQTVRGIENLVTLGQRVVMNSVIAQANSSDLPALASLLVGLGVRQFQLAFVHILGTAAAEQGSVVPRKTDVLPFVREALEIGRTAKVPCFTEAIPFCLMTGYEEHVAETIIPETTVYDAEAVIADYGEYRRDEGKAKRGDCRRCVHDAVCEGPWREYPEIFGWEEFVPVKSPRSEEEPLSRSD